MAFRKMYTLYENGENTRIQFLHEILKAPDETMDLSGMKAPHTQDYYELIYFTGGTRRIRVEEKEYSFGAGDIFVVAPGQPHSGFSDPCTLDRYCLYVMPEVFSGIPDSDGVMHLFKELAGKGCHKITLTKAQQEKAGHYMTNIDNAIKFGSEKSRNAVAFADTVKLLSYLSDTVCGGFGDTPKNKLLLNILSYIDSSFSFVTVPEIERQFGVSRSTLWRMFKSEMHMSPTAYIKQIRLEISKLMLLKDTDVQTVSNMCGFSDCSYFIKSFKEAYGETPLSYKKKGINI